MNTTRSRTIVPALLLSVALALTACGSDTGADSGTDPGGGQTPATTVAASPIDAALAYAECMREHGVEGFPDPEDVGGRVLIQGPPTDDPDVPEAHETCEPLMDSGSGFTEPDEEQMAQMQERMLAFAKCMREHGIDMPDPEMSDDGFFEGSAGGGSPDDPKFKAAEEACGGGLPGFGGQGPGR